MVEKVKVKLQRWDVRQLSLAGRAILAQSSLGDGNIIRCWKDSRVPRIGPLINLIPSRNNIDEDCFLREMITENGPERVAWTGTSLGSFSIKSVYRVIKEKTWNSKDDLWKLSWKFQGPQSSFFIWLAKEVWTQVVFVGEQVFFFSGDMQEWFTNNLQNRQDLAFGGVDWSVFFGLASWRIWENKNLYVFQGSPWHAGDIIKGSITWAKQYGILPNVNFKVDSKFAIDGGVLRDERGECILGFNQRLGRCAIVEAELWGILDGLSLLQGRQWDRVLLQTNSLEASLKQ
ncbi:hypothetical protein Goshw_006727 [Gossypium schwendimanii]|uniref:RNase H type-1 domain-containing protein n=1 Tax=Gossypium schwendimanii TaxID=34291 RepID=A0A7J9LUB6_GOSSC|nr:hypothetical protein [Gossypium schwendimanii]